MRGLQLSEKDQELRLPSGLSQHSSPNGQWTIVFRVGNETHL